MRLTELLTYQVVTEGGRHLGKVVDLRCTTWPTPGEPQTEQVVSELVFGKAGWLERLGFRAIKEQRVAWQAVRAIKRRKIILAPEAINTL
jgi:sporulation protein YlmC with PRC-barrel domain